MNFKDLVKKVKAIRKRGREAIIVVRDEYEETDTTTYVRTVTNDYIYCDNPVNGYGYEFSDDDDFYCVIDVKSIDKKVQNKIVRLSEEKKPSNKKKHVGVEIELVSKLDEIELSIKLAKSNLDKYVCVKEDMSIDTSDAYPYAHELCVLGDEKNIFKVVKKLSKILASSCSVNATCGLHVHLDMRQRDVQNAYANLFQAQPLLYAMCPGTRLRNTYCQPTTQYVNITDPGANQGRYVGINHTSYDKHQTIEIRIHSGTLAADKINNWIKLLIRIADKPAESISRVRMMHELEEYKKELSLTPTLEKYVKERVQKFKQQHKESDIKLAA